MKFIDANGNVFEIDEDGDGAKKMIDEKIKRNDEQRMIMKELNREKPAVQELIVRQQYANDKQLKARIIQDPTIDAMKDSIFFDD